jgi:hypothetical protein
MLGSAVVSKIVAQDDEETKSHVLGTPTDSREKDLENPEARTTAS